MGIMLTKASKCMHLTIRWLMDGQLGRSVLRQTYPALTNPSDMTARCVRHRIVQGFAIDSLAIVQEIRAIRFTERSVLRQTYPDLLLKLTAKPPRYRTKGYILTNYLKLH